MKLLKTYYKLTKPGIIYGNLVGMAAGFFLASKSHINLQIFLAAFAGIFLVIASACVCNNYIDRDLDKNMLRTQNRSLVIGEIPARNAIIYAIILGLLGFLVLILFTNPLTVLIGFLGFFIYVVLYSIAKRRTVYGTIIGSFSGAMPLVAGYTAVLNRIDSGVIILFLILGFWQMPHFYAITIYRLKDYKATGLLVWPVKKGVQSTKWQILWFVVAFFVAALLLFAFGYTGYFYLIVVLLIGSIWIWLSIQGFRTKDDALWARKMFFYSLITLLVLCFTMSVNAV